MKFSLLTAAGIISAISQATAVTIVTPWAQTVWTSGGHGLITWNATAAEAGLKCDIYLLNGVTTNSNIVAQITDPATPVDCGVGAYDIHPLNDFATGQYSIRIGQASTGTWSYSSLFQFNGNGTASPISLASTAAAPTGVTGTAAAAASAAKTAISSAAPAASGSSAVKSASASASGAKTSETSGASAMSVSTAAVALGAIAAVAFNL